MTRPKPTSLSLNKIANRAMALGLPLIVSAPLALASSGDHGRAPQKSPVHSGEPRLISLAPSNTELLCSIGAVDDLIGVCTNCDYPSKVKCVSRVGTFVSANLERLSVLSPDYVLLVSGQEMLSSQLTHNNFKTVILDNSHLENISTNMQKLGSITGKSKEAAAAADCFESALKELKAALPHKQSGPKVFYCVWPQPLMTAGKDSFLNEVITACGGVNIAGDIGSSYPRYSLEQLVLKNPDVIIMPYEAKGQGFLDRAPWTMLKAVREKRLYFLPDAGHDTLSRPTMRVLQGMGWLADILHPEAKEQLHHWRQSSAFIRSQSLATDH